MLNTVIYNRLTWKYRFTIVV